MPSRQDCLDDIARRAGKRREDAEDLFDQIDERAQAYQHDGLSPDEAYAKARDEMLQAVAERAALARRAEILDARREIVRHRSYDAAAKAIRELSPRLAVQEARLALEARLVGVNVPFKGNRKSVDATFVGLRRRWVGGFARDLEQAGLLKIFASRAIEDKWTDELFELNSGRKG